MKRKTNFPKAIPSNGVMSEEEFKRKKQIAKELFKKEDDEDVEKKIE